tara:strand:- start:492 stop:656 length:165 start_codon:yes stop_codon:yes gene_type:complete
LGPQECFSEVYFWDRLGTTEGTNKLPKNVAIVLKNFSMTKIIYNLGDCCMTIYL